MLPERLRSRSLPWSVAVPPKPLRWTRETLETLETVRGVQASAIAQRGVPAMSGLSETMRQGSVIQRGTIGTGIATPSAGPAMAIGRVGPEIEGDTAKQSIGVNGSMGPEVIVQKVTTEASVGPRSDALPSERDALQPPQRLHEPMMQAGAPAAAAARRRARPSAEVDLHLWWRRQQRRSTVVPQASLPLPCRRCLRALQCEHLQRQARPAPYLQQGLLARAARDDLSKIWTHWMPSWPEWSSTGRPLPPVS